MGDPADEEDDAFLADAPDYGALDDLGTETITIATPRLTRLLLGTEQSESGDTMSEGGPAPVLLDNTGQGSLGAGGGGGAVSGERLKKKRPSIVQSIARFAHRHKSPAPKRTLSSWNGSGAQEFVPHDSPSRSGAHFATGEGGDRHGLYAARHSYTVGAYYSASSPARPAASASLAVQVTVTAPHDVQSLAAPLPSSLPSPSLIERDPLLVSPVAIKSVPSVIVSPHLHAPSLVPLPSSSSLPSGPALASEVTAVASANSDKKEETRPLLQP